MAYVYRHIRLDKNEPFYIGIGTNAKNAKTFNEEYARAFLIKCRSEFWHNITNKTTYQVEIVFEHDDIKVIKEKEIELIKLYGRRDLGQGTLVNHTDGGDGCHGLIRTKESYKKAILTKIKNGTTKLSEETKRKISNSNKGKKVDDSVKLSISKKLSGRKVPKEIVEKGLETRRINRSNGILPNYKQEVKDKLSLKFSKKVLQYDLNSNFIKEWSSLTEISKHVEFSISKISLCCNGRRNKHKGFIWKFKDNLI